MELIAQYPGIAYGICVTIGFAVFIHQQSRRQAYEDEKRRNKQ